MQRDFKDYKTNNKTKSIKTFTHFCRSEATYTGKNTIKNSGLNITHASLLNSVTDYFSL